MKFEAGMKVTLYVGNFAVNRNVLEVRDGAVYLVEGGDAFNAETGKVWDNHHGKGRSPMKKIVPQV